MLIKTLLNAKLLKGTLTVFKKLEKIFLVKRKKYFLQLVRGIKGIDRHKFNLSTNRILFINITSL